MIEPLGPHRINVYVDGFNLYYGSLQDTPYRWLNLRALCSALAPEAYVQRIYYFTARVSAPPNDLAKPARQDAYLRALRTLPRLTIQEGHFRTDEYHLRRVIPRDRSNPSVPNPANRKVWVWRTHEKASDVNLATQLLIDACSRDFDHAWVVSNDADLAYPIDRVRRLFRRTIGVWKPERPPTYPGDRHRPDSYDLRQAAHWFRRIHEWQLAAAQFPASLVDANGTITKPPGW